MPFDRHLEIDANVVVFVAKGEICGQDYVVETESMLATLPLPPPFHCLYDLRESTFVGDLHVLKKLASEISRADWPRGQRVAQVVSSDADYGLVRMFSTLATDGPVEYKLFLEIDEARAWVGLPPLDG